MGLRVVTEELKKEARMAPIGCLLVLLEWHLKWEWVEGGLGGMLVQSDLSIQMGTAIQFTPAIQMAKVMEAAMEAAFLFFVASVSYR